LEKIKKKQQIRTPGFLNKKSAILGWAIDELNSNEIQSFQKKQKQRKQSEPGELPKKKNKSRQKVKKTITVSLLKNQLLENKK
jgi:hypothetical protein